MSLPAPSEPPEPSRVSFPGWGKAVRHWVYRSANGQPLFATYRFEKPSDEPGEKPKKDVLPYSFGRREWDIKSGTRKGERTERTGWHFKRPMLPVPLYGLDRLAAMPDAAVVICEGEKAADAATEMFPTFVSVSSQGGSGAGDKADWSALAGRVVIIWQDNDAAGSKHTGKIAPLLNEAGATSLAVVTVPAEWPSGWDVADDMPAGITVDKLAAMLLVAEPIEFLSEDQQAKQDSINEQIKWLADLPSVEYQVQRKSAASRLGMGVTALDKVIKTEKAKRAQAAAAAERKRPPPAPGHVRWPGGFTMEDDGLYADMGEQGLLWICAPIEVLGAERDTAGESWGLWLRFRDQDSKPHNWSMPNSMLMVGPGELEAALVHRGLVIAAEPAARALLRQALSGVKTGNRVTLVPRTGWHVHGQDGHSAYVLADGETVGKTAERLVLKGAADGAVQSMTVGTLEAWQASVGTLTSGNHLAMFCICCGFVGPLLDVIGEPSGGFHLHGKSKEGKTLALSCAVSLWNRPKKGGGLRDWRTTANGMEAAAEESNDGLLALDEMHQADPREVVAATYMLANESGKGRLSRDTSARARKVWRLIVVSTGELDVASIVAKANQVVPAGADVRLPSVPVSQSGSWPDLHGHTNTQALMRALYEALSRHYGTAGRAFLDVLVAEREQDERSIVEAFAAMRTKFEHLLPADADQQIKDVARRFAMSALAGEMAIGWDILPWEENDAYEACAAMMKLWLSRRGSAASSEETVQVRTIRLFLLENGASRFVVLKKEKGIWDDTAVERVVINRAGWRMLQPDGRSEYVIPPEVWKEVCAKAGIDPTETARTLIDKGFVIPGEGKNLQKRVRIPGLGSSRYFVVSPELLGIEDAKSTSNENSEQEA